MPNWIAITKADLYNTKAARLIDKINSLQLGDGQNDRSTGIIADVTAEIRRRISRCNVLDQDVSKIPAGLKPLAIDLIIIRLKNAVEADLTDAEKMTMSQRNRELDRIADGTDLVDAPDNPIPANMNQSIASPSFGCRRNRRNFEG